MDTKQYFTDNQEVLLWLANTSAGKHLIGAKPSDKIVKVSPNSFHRLEAIEKDKIILTGIFRTYENVAKELLPILTKSQIAQMPVRDEAWVGHASGLEVSSKYPSVFLDVGTYYADASGDGWVIKDNSTSWSTTRDAADGTNKSNTGSTGFRDVASYYVTYYNICRSFFPSDTSALTEDATIDSADFSVDVSSLGGTNPDAILVATTQASTSTIALDDYDQVGSTGFSSAVTISSTGRKTFSMNASGLAAISKTGTTKMGLRNKSYDFDNVNPGTGVNNRYVVFYYANQTGTTNDPYYEITYTLPVTGNAIFFGTNF